MATSEILSERSRLWKKGRALEAGKLIFENLPIRKRPHWAARVLRLVVDRTGVHSQPVELAIRTANTPDDWVNAHDVFSVARSETLELDRLRELSPQQDLLLKHLVLAELVAKVTYNSTNPVDEFDEDSGWWVAPCLKRILDSLDDAEFSAVAWSTLVSDEKVTD